MPRRVNVKARLIEALRKKPMRWSELLEQAGVSKGALSTHLNELIDGEVVLTRVNSGTRPPTTTYKINESRLREKKVVSNETMMKLLESSPLDTIPGSLQRLTSATKDLVQTREKEKIALAKSDPEAREILLRDTILVKVLNGESVYFVPEEEEERWEPYVKKTRGYTSIAKAKKRWVKEKVDSIVDYMEQIYEIPTERGKVEEIVHDMFREGIIEFSDKRYFGPLYTNRTKKLIQSFNWKHKKKFGSDSQAKKALKSV